MTGLYSGALVLRLLATSLLGGFFVLIFLDVPWTSGFLNEGHAVWNIVFAICVWLGLLLAPLASGINRRQWLPIREIVVSLLILMPFLPYFDTEEVLFEFLFDGWTFEAVVRWILVSALLCYPIVIWHDVSRLRSRKL